MLETLDAPVTRNRPATRDRAWPAVILCIPTFRRPDGLRKLLIHVGRLRYQGRLSVIVIDNDGEQLAGAAVVAQMSPVFPFPLAYIVEPRRGQTYAYNRGFVSAARATPAAGYVAVLDDDEYPEPPWLADMMTMALGLDADI